MMEEEPTSRLTARRITASPERRLAVLKVLAGPNPGKLVRLEPGTMTIGRGPNNDLVLKDAQISRSHARLEFDEDTGVLLKDLKSTNGTTVEGEPITARVLKNGDQVALGDSVVLRFSFLDVLEEQVERAMFERANPEPLSVGRPEFLEHIKNELAVSVMHNQPLTVALVGLDGFKELNDSRGHNTGDALLRELVPRIRAILRSRDQIGRYSGDEFGLVFPEMQLADARAQLERIRLAIARRPFGGDLKMTVSIGSAQSGLHGKNADALLESAARALAQARDAGCDRVVSGPSDDAPLPGKGSAKQPKQQRAMTRVNCNIAVVCKQGDKTFKSRVLDIGLNGMRLAVLERFAPGTRLEVVPEAGGMEPINIEVLWCRKRRNQEVLEIGIKFPDSEEKQASSWVRVAMQRLGFGVIPVTERRQSIRLEMAYPLALIHGPLRFPIKLVNLSAEGAAVEGAESVNAGAAVKLAGLPGGQDLSGKVIYCRPLQASGSFRMGIRLVKPAPDALLSHFQKD